ncbi:hypothetical protein [Streptomyces sp. YGL11-2]|uniref:hypothetical protein n=1 Tax=Streptomyces sp. YGL11-2 TaxID=3414028 RepID=UPI003CED09B4
MVDVVDGALRVPPHGFEALVQRVGLLEERIEVGVELLRSRAPPIVRVAELLAGRLNLLQLVLVGHYGLVETVRVALGVRTGENLNSHGHKPSCAPRPCHCVPGF